MADDADSLHADRFSPLPPLLAVHLGAGTRQAMAGRLMEGPDRSFPQRRLAGGDCGGMRGHPAGKCYRAPRPAARLGGDDDGISNDRSARASRPLYRCRFGPGAPGGIRRNAFGHPLQRHQSAEAVAALVASFAHLRHRVPCQPCHQKVCPLADHPCMSGLGPERVSKCDAVVVAHPPGGVAACTDLKMATHSLRIGKLRGPAPLTPPSQGGEREHICQGNGTGAVGLPWRGCCGGAGSIA